ncbi:MAG: Smr/MutS family protein [Oligoflexia bacterium]|nr:Smr/MutS family protein [Oligoflexia bacterium]
MSANHRELDWPSLLDKLSAHAHSERAKELCRNLSPQDTSAKAILLIENIKEAQSIILESELPDLSVIDHISPISERLNVHAVLDVKELIVLRQFLNTAQNLKTLLKQPKNKWANSESARIADFKSQISAINHVLSPSGEINEDASPTLASLCEERRRLGREISKTLDQIVARRQMENILQDKYVTNREGRMVIPVKSGSQHDVKGLIHDASQTKQTVFMEPDEVIPMNNRLREVQIHIAEEIYRILKELSQYLTRFVTSFINADHSLIEADVTFAKAYLNQNIKGTLPLFSNQDRFGLINLRHPLLVLQGIKVIPNTVTMGENRKILLLSGPNAGGKTVLLKAIGLAAQMARCGLPVACDDGSELPFFKQIDPIIGDLQSVGENLSSFSSHIARLNLASRIKGEGNLILVDEICGATDPEEGAALARSFIEHFCQQKVFAVITSHLGPLKEHWSKETGVEHGSLEFDLKTNKPTYQLLIGFPGRSLALAVAEKLGVLQDIIKRAKSHLSPVGLERSQELEEIEDFKEQIIELKNQTLIDSEEAKKAKNQYQELVKKFREQRDRWLEKALQKAEKKIENLIEDARQDRLRNKTLHDIKAELPEIVKAKPSQNKPQTLEDFKRDFKPGTPAYSTRLSRQVIIQGEPDHKGQVPVLADMMRVQLPWHTLIGLGQKEEQPVQVIRRSSSAQSIPIDDNASELDLRGQRIDEAVTRLEKWLDDCMREQKDSVKIIHGFGTEQLKKAVRQFLSKSRYVAKWNAGDKNTGGDGVTWVTLSD